MLAPRLLVLLVLVATSSARQLWSEIENLEISFTPVPDFESTTSVQPENKCFTKEEAVKLCNVNIITSEEVVVDEEVRDWNVTEEENATETWQIGSWSERSRALLERRLYTDCTFVVGPDDHKQEFRAHRVILVAASPVLESLLRDHEGRVLRMRDVSPQAFKSVLEFVYTGGVCLRSFSEACELVGVASRLQVVQLARQSRAFLASSLHPGNVWQALQCARTHADQRLEDDAMQLIGKETEKSLTDPLFVEIPQSSLVSLLQKDILNVSSEVVLFDASLRWAMAEAKRRGLPQKPEGLKEALGPALGLIRFLTLSPREFTDLQATSKILNYPESLAVIFNINSPGVMELPTNLSSSTEPRIAPEQKNYFEIFDDLNSLACNVKPNIISRNYLDGITTTRIRNNNYRVNLFGIQIPKRIVEPCSSSYMEDLTVQILNYDYEVLHSMDFKELVSGSCAPSDQLLNLKFKTRIPLTYQGGTFQSHEPAKFRVVFHKPGRYPTSLGSGFFTLRNRHRHPYFMDKSGIYWTYGANNFVYSMFTDDDEN